MGNWQEKIREIKEAERQKVANQQKHLSLQQQEEQLRLQKEEELRSAAEKQRVEAREKFFGILDSLQIWQKLEEVKHQVWQDRGTVVKDRTGIEKFMRLSFDYKTTIPEIQKKEWSEVVEHGVEYVEGAGQHYFNKTERKSKTRVVNQYSVIKPSYLEVGISYQISEIPTLYILDTEVELSIWENNAFNDLAKKAGGTAICKSREIQYTDTDGNIFKKEPHPEDVGGWGWLTGHNIDTSYSLTRSHYARCASVILSSQSDMKALDNFINYGIALSCWLRIPQSKLPFQLQLK